MRILVTGVDGFVGHHAARLLLESGHELIGLTEDGSVPAGVRPVRADIRDQHVLLRNIEAQAPEAVLHLAAISFVPAVRSDPCRAFEINASGTLTLLTCLQQAVPGIRVVVISSSEVYGQVEESDLPLSEDNPLRPVTLYGASKAAAEHLCRVHAREGMDVVVLRPFNHIGPGQREEFVVSSFAHQVARVEREEGDPVLRHGNLDAVRDFLDVRDVVSAYELALTAGRGLLEPGLAYNLCSGQGVRIGLILEKLVGRAIRSVRTEVDPQRLRPVDVPEFVGRPERFRRATGFEPGFSLDQTLEDVLEEARRAISARP